MWCFIVFLLTVKPHCTDTADSGWACCSHIIHCPAPSLSPPRTLISSNEHNLCLAVSSLESPTSKPGIWIIKLLFLAFPLHVTDLPSWSSLPASPPYSLYPYCIPSFMLFPPCLSLSLWCFLQIADLYKKQQQIQNQGDKAEHEDYYWSADHPVGQGIIKNGNFNVIVNSIFLFVMLNGIKALSFFFRFLVHVSCHFIHEMLVYYFSFRVKTVLISGCMRCTSIPKAPIDSAVTPYSPVIDPYREFAVQNCPAKHDTYGLHTNTFSWPDFCWSRKGWQQSAFSTRGDRRTSQGDHRLPKMLLGGKRKDGVADSCLNSRTKEKHSQPALDDGNPLTVHPESIKPCWRWGGVSARAKDRLLLHGSKDGCELAM